MRCKDKRTISQCRSVQSNTCTEQQNVAVSSARRLQTTIKSDEGFSQHISSVVRHKNNVTKGTEPNEIFLAMIYLYSWCHVRFIRYPGGREKKAATQLLCSPRTHCDTFIWEYVCVKRYTPRLFPTEYGRIKNGKVCFNLFAEIFIDRYKNISVLTDNILFMNGIRTSFAFRFL